MLYLLLQGKNKTTKIYGALYRIPFTFQLTLEIVFVSCTLYLIQPPKLKEVNKGCSVAGLFLLSCSSFTFTRFNVRSSSAEDYICCSSKASFVLTQAGCLMERYHMGSVYFQWALSLFQTCGNQMWREWLFDLELRASSLLSQRTLSTFRHQQFPALSQLSKTLGCQF